MVFVPIFSSEKHQPRIGKNGSNSEKRFSLLYLLTKFQSEKKSDITLNLKRSLHKPRKVNAAMNPIFGLGHEIYELK